MVSNASNPFSGVGGSAGINALDFRGLADIQRQARGNDPKALKAVAQQFEALFLQMVMKSMREATPREGMFDSEQSRMYESLLDQQLAQVLSTRKGVGLADVLVRQMTRQAAAVDGEQELFDALPRLDAIPRNGKFPAALAQPGAVTPAPTFESVEGVTGALVAPTAQARDFVARVLPDAKAAARRTGIPAEFLVAHAALETGWGRSEPRGTDGRLSHNLFGIKAGRGWTGDSVEATTTEYVQGQPQRQVERFRAYGSYADSFRDYANLLASSPRYASVLGEQDPARFARGLQAAGYATDPAYASKLERVIGSLAMNGAAPAG
jgi:flagellar protein FlgJ